MVDTFVVHTPILKPAYRNNFSGLESSGKAFWLSQYIKSNPSSLLVVVTHNQNELTKLETQLLFFGVEPLVFADWETLVYDQLTVHQDISSERIGLLVNMPMSGVILVSVQTLMQRIVPPSWLLGRHFDLVVG